jgi:hypothetical protein
VFQEINFFWGGILFEVMKWRVNWGGKSERFNVLRPCENRSFIVNGIADDKFQLHNFYTSF